MSHQTVIVLDFGGQYNQLIARRVRECGVYCEVKPYTTPLADIRAMNPIGIIFTGGPNSVYDPKSPQVDPAIFTWGVPILGICYGCQLMAHNLGGRVTEAQDDSAREYGKTETYFDSACKLFKGLPAQGITWMSHGDYMEKVPEGFALVAHSDACPNVAICDESRGFYGVQYHPEVNHTEHGTDMIRNFLYEVCGAAGDWTMGDYKETAIRQIREKVGDGKVLLALSGGVDSSVVAALLLKAIGNQLVCVHVNHGLMRKGESEQVVDVFQNQLDANLVYVDATDRFLELLDGVAEPEAKRKIIGAEFIRVFEEEARKLKKKLVKNQFNFNDFIGQIQQIKKMGNLKDLASMLPGMGKMLKNVDIPDDVFKQTEAIISSMTPAERERPEIINARRRERIAKGSGTTMADVNRLMKQFEDTRKMMKAVAGGGMKMPKMPGMRR